MRRDHITLPKTEAELAAEAARAAAHERKQRWKELPGNRYTPEELRAMSGEFADCTMHRVRRKRRVMHIS